MFVFRDWNFLWFDLIIFVNAEQFLCFTCNIIFSYICLHIKIHLEDNVLQDLSGSVLLLQFGLRVYLLTDVIRQLHVGDGKYNHPQSLLKALEPFCSIGQKLSVANQSVSGPI